MFIDDIGGDTDPGEFEPDTGGYDTDMIVFYVGGTGCGKSYFAVKKMMELLKTGRRIYSNMDGFDKPECREWISQFTQIPLDVLEEQLIFIPPTKTRTFWEDVEPGSVINIDEIHKWYHARDWGTSSNKNFGIWASEHRKAGYDLLLITQNITKCEKTVRELATFTYMFKKLNMFGSIGEKKFMMRAYMEDDTQSRPMTTRFYNYDPAIFQCYKSYINEEIKEEGLLETMNVFRKPIFIAIPVMIGISLYFASKSGFLGGANANPVKAAKERTERIKHEKRVHKRVEKQSEEVKNPIEKAVIETVREEEEKDLFELIATVNGTEYHRNIETGHIVRRQKGRP